MSGLTDVGWMVMRRISIKVRNSEEEGIERAGAEFP
jgi:hypothetical protein